MEVKLGRLQFALLGAVLLGVALLSGGLYVAADRAVADLVITRTCEALPGFMTGGLDRQLNDYTRNRTLIRHYAGVLQKTAAPFGLTYLYVYDQRNMEVHTHVDQTVVASGNDRTGLSRFLEERTERPAETVRSTHTLAASRVVLLDFAFPAGKGWIRAGFREKDVLAYRGQLLGWTLGMGGSLFVIVLVVMLVGNHLTGKRVARFAFELQEKVRVKTRAEVLAEIKKQQAAEARKADDAPLDSNEFFGIIDLAKKVGGTFDLDAILHQTVGAVVRVLGVQEVMLFLIDEQGTELRATIGHDAAGMIEPQAINDVRVRVGQGEIGSAAEYGGTTIIDTPQPGAAMVSALTANGSVIGVLRVKGKVNGKPFGKRDKLIGRQFADLVGNAVYTALAYRAAGGVVTPAAAAPETAAPARPPVPPLPVPPPGEH